MAVRRSIFSKSIVGACKFSNVRSSFFGIPSAAPQKLISVLPVIITFTLHNNPLFWDVKLAGSTRISE